MKVAAYCGKDWAKAMRASTGVRPATSPPLEADIDVRRARFANMVVAAGRGRRENAEKFHDNQEVER